MRMRSLVGSSCLSAAIATLIHAVAPSDAAACSCLQPTVESSYNHSTDVVTVEVRREFVLGDTRYFLVRVQQTFKGCLQPRESVLLSTPVQSATCGSELPARKHLINGTAARSRFGLPVLNISLCNYDVPTEALTEHDLAFLNGRTVCCGDSCTCADGTAPVSCLVDPCSVAPACEEGTCVANYCGGCNAEFYDPSGSPVCQALVSECEKDDDCPKGEWCRQAQSSAPEPVYECVPFVGEGSSCDGFTTPWMYEQCEPGLTCDTPDFVADAGGICRRNCTTNADCAEAEYCAADKLCDSDGACEHDVDCELPGNTYLQIECVGFGVCNDGQCARQCGNAQCIDLAGWDFGPCDAVLGWAVENGACAELSGCTSGDFKLFKNAAMCTAACP